MHISPDTPDRRPDDRGGRQRVRRRPPELTGSRSAAASPPAAGRNRVQTRSSATSAMPPWPRITRVTIANSRLPSIPSVSACSGASPSPRTAQRKAQTGVGRCEQQRERQPGECKVQHRQQAQRRSAQALHQSPADRQRGQRSARGGRRQDRQPLPGTVQHFDARRVEHDAESDHRRQQQRQYPVRPPRHQPGDSVRGEKWQHPVRDGHADRTHRRRRAAARRRGPRTRSDGCRGRRRTAAPRRCPPSRTARRSARAGDRRPGWRAPARQSRCRSRSRRSRAAARRMPRIRRCRPCRSEAARCRPHAAAIGQRSRSAGGGVTCSQRGPAVNMKPAMIERHVRRREDERVRDRRRQRRDDSRAGVRYDQHPGPAERHREQQRGGDEEGDPVGREPEARKRAAAARSVLPWPTASLGGASALAAEACFKAPSVVRQRHAAAIERDAAPAAGTARCRRCSACEAGTKPPRRTSNTCTSPSSMT